VAITPGFLGIDEPAVIDKRADTNVVTRAATTVHREVVSIGSPDDATPESIAKVDSTGSLRTVSTDAAGTNQQAITAAGDAKVTLDGEAVAISGTVPVSGPLTDTQLRASAVPISAATLPLPSGAATSALQTQPGVDIGDVTINNASGAAAVNIQDGGNAITVDGTVTANAGTGTRDVQGNVAHGAADSGNPVKVGGKGRTTNPAAVADGDRADLYVDDLGKPVVRLCAPRDLLVTQTTTITGTTETTILTSVASTFLDLVMLIISNTSLTAIRIDFRDATAGTIRFSVYVPAGDTRGFSIPGVPIPQTTAGNNWTAQLSLSATDVRIYALAMRDV